MRLPDRSSRRRTVAGLACAVALVAAAACGSTQTTPTPAASGLTSLAPPETGLPTNAASGSAGPASPSLSATATPGVTATPAPAATTPLPSVKISLTKIVGGLGSSIGVVSAGDSRLFVIVQTGKIVIVDGGAVTGTFLDITSRTNSAGSERGLIGLAFHPQYASNGRFFVRYTDKTGDVRISEFHVGSDPNQADATSEKSLVTVPHRLQANHNGGTIAFGPDGYLYVGTGDGGGGGDPTGNGQKLSVLLGKMLRIDVDHTSGSLNYAVPTDNPFVGQTGKRAEIWAYGLRNPYGFSFDRATGDLWIADVGQNLWEEVDRATAADGLGRGVNYGWNAMEGRHCYNPASGCSTKGKVMPLAEYNHGSGDSNGCSIIGGFVYRGSAHPELVGRYFFGDYCSGKIWDVAAAGPSSQSIQYLYSSGLRITGWGQGADGELYVVATNGGLYQLT
jgi:glucose/arabinose dehydrogenase